MICSPVSAPIRATIPPQAARGTLRSSATRITLAHGRDLRSLRFAPATSPGPNDTSISAMRAPHDITILNALDRLRGLQPARAPTGTVRLTDPAGGVLLFDMQGMRLAGSIREAADVSLADAAAAEGAGLVREAARVARMLDLGTVRHVVMETADAKIAMLPVNRDGALLIYRSAATPLGRLLGLAGDAARAARDWIGSSS